MCGFHLIILRDITFKLNHSVAVTKHLEIYRVKMYKNYNITDQSDWYLTWLFLGSNKSTDAG